MPNFITQVDKDKAKREPIKDLNQFMERKGEQLFGEGIGDMEHFREKYPTADICESENGIHIAGTSDPEILRRYTK